MTALVPGWSYTTDQVKVMLNEAYRAGFVDGKEAERRHREVARERVARGR